MRKPGISAPVASDLQSSSIDRVFRDACLRNPEWPLVCLSKNKTVSYLDVWKDVLSLVRYLDRTEVSKGDRVIVYSEKNADILRVALACSFAGVVFIPVSPLFSADFLRLLVADTDAKIIFCDPENFGMLDAMGARVMGFGGWGNEAGLAESDQQAADALQNWQSRVSSSEAFIIQPTSGSTGKPKLVVRSHSSVLRYASFLKPMISDLHRNDQPRVLFVSILTHSFAFHVLGTTLALGGALLIPNDVDASSSLTDVRAFKPTVIALTPRVLRSYSLQTTLLGEPALSFGDSAKVLLSAGGRADESTLKKLKASGVEIVEFYGSTEASLVSLTPAGAWKPGSSGVILPDIEFKIAGDGELLLNTPGIMMGYFGGGDVGADAFDPNGFYKTGDLVEISPDGYMKILGRKSDVYSSYEGTYLYPERIESALESISGVSQVFVAGDGQPNLSALIVIEYADGAHGVDTNGYLEPKDFPFNYVRLGKEIERINQGFERIEKIVRFALLSKAFPSDQYAIVAAGKVRRDRKGLSATYRDLIAALNEPCDPKEQDDVSFVPGVNRRLRVRKGAA